jgi:hypothetical protein
MHVHSRRSMKSIKQKGKRKRGMQVADSASYIME